MAGTVKIKEALTLKHQANLGEEIAEVPFEAGEELTVLQEWERAYLVKDGEGRLFNVPKDRVEPAD